MNESKFNSETRQFIKQMSASSQRYTEHIVMGQRNSSVILDIKTTLEANSIGLNHCLDETITME